MPKVLIIIVTWNKKDYVLDLLDSVKKLDYAVADMDVLVVDNASNDGTVDAIRETHPDVQLICNEENIGGTGGFNTGLSHAFEQPADKYQYLWLLDNDVLVHRRALNELVDILEQNDDIAVAGSTMMQLDYPWRVNEMGAFVNKDSGELVLNRHLEEVQAWQGKTATALSQEDVDLAKHLVHCLPVMDVEYVAAASLLIRAEVAREAGIWKDFFIHFDDVEWCLRIGRMGWRVVVSARSLIWHLSAAAKVPTWVLYYDNRNILELMREHGVSQASIKRQAWLSLKRGLYYTLMGKTDLGRLHKDAVDDYFSDTFGKKDIKLEYRYQSGDKASDIFMDPKIKRILVSFPVNFQATGLQEPMVKAMKQRDDLQVDFLSYPDGLCVYQLPTPRFVMLPMNRFRRWWKYLRLRNQYDLVMQSDYQMIVGLSWLNAELLFVNDEGICRRPAPKFSDVLKAAGWLIRYRLFGKTG